MGYTKLVDLFELVKENLINGDSSTQTGLCTVIRNMERDNIISNNHKKILLACLRKHKPTPTNYFSEFMIYEYWEDYHYWWLRICDNIKTKQVRIDYLTKLISYYKLYYMENKRQVEILELTIKELPNKASICEALQYLHFDDRITTEEAFFISNLLEKHKPTPDNEYKEFTENLYWLNSSNPISQGLWWKIYKVQIRIEYLKKLVENIKIH